MMQRNQQQHGFTLIELVTVITILGLIAVAVVPRFTTTSSFETRTAQDQLISAIRQAQQLAMNKAVSANVQLQTDSANHRIRISYDEGGTQTIDTSITDNIGLTVTTIGFLKSGDVNTATTIAISPGSRQVCIEATGYAHSC
jgi:MSHA pilin protein MshC